MLSETFRLCFPLFAKEPDPLVRVLFPLIINTLEGNWGGGGGGGVELHKKHHLQYLFHTI